MTKLLSSVIVLGSLTFSYAQCDGFEMTLTPISPTCHNFTDGLVDIDITGGTAPINITIENEWGMFFPGKSIEMVPSGWYYVTAVDSNGCHLYDSVFVPNPPQIVAMITVTDPGFTGACDGIAEVDTVLNYQGSFSNIGYFWSPGGPSGFGEMVKSDLCDANYTLVINDEYGCSIVEELAVGSVSVSELRAPNEILVFPNPASDFVQIKSHIPIEEIDLIDSSGRMVQTFFGNGTTEQLLNLQDLPAGSYLIRLKSGDYFQMERLVIAKL